MPSLSRKQPDLFLVTIANLAALAAVIYEYRFGDLERTPGLITCVVGIFGVNALILVSIRLRNRRNERLIPRNLIVVTIMFAVISAAIGVLVILLSPSGGDVVKLAYSKIPLIVIHPEPKRLMVGLLRRRATNSRIYSQVAASAKPLDPPLYSTESFANENACRETFTRLQQVAATESAYFAQQEQVGKEFRDKLTRIDPASSFLDAADSLQAPAVEMNTVEKAWLSSALALYDFAGRHAREMTVSNGTLNFTSESTRLEFVKQLATSQDLFQKFQQRLQDATAKQKQARSAAGLAN